jgi:hypothetical protein
MRHSSSPRSSPETAHRNRRSALEDGRGFESAFAALVRGMPEGYNTDRRIFPRKKHVDRAG